MIKVITGIKNINTTTPKLPNNPSVSLWNVWLSIRSKITTAITNKTVFIQKTTNIPIHLFPSFLIIQREVSVDAINDNNKIIRTKIFRITPPCIVLICKAIKLFCIQILGMVKTLVFDKTL